MASKYRTILMDKADNVKHFPKVKRENPEDEEYDTPVFHPCTEFHTSFKWMLQIRGGNLCLICTDCAETFTIEEIMKATEDEDG